MVAVRTYRLTDRPAVRQIYGMDEFARPVLIQKYPRMSRRDPRTTGEAHAANALPDGALRLAWLAVGDHAHRAGCEGDAVA